MRTTTATHFQANINSFIDSVINDSHEVIINRGDDAFILISLDEYNSLKETEYLMSSKEMEKAVLQGMEDVKNDNFEEVDIDAL